MENRLRLHRRLLWPEVSSPSMSSPPPPYVVLSPEGSPSSGKRSYILASSAIMHDAANARATERRLAARAATAATHAAKAAASMPPTGVGDYRVVCSMKFVLAFSTHTVVLSIVPYTHERLSP